MGFHLAWIRYVVKNQQKYALVVMIGNSGSKLLVLKSASIPVAEIMLIRKNLKKLSGMPINDRVIWLKSNCQTSYKQAFRSLPASSTQEIYTYDIGIFADEMEKAKTSARKAH